ncbi:hypothetical protein [Neptuniibacter marinus]|uniref:hypothetical protein n=1 Tax=Neptuniibacter marinus TaxID=1806670 RepID=UPI003B5B1C09
MINLKKLSALVQSPKVLLKKYESIILLSHMRARSSVLSHVLGNNNEIAGYYEQHLDHKDKFFNIKVKANLLLEGNFPPENTYIYDKVLHDRFDPRSFKEYKVIVLIRDPRATLKSILSMGSINNSIWQDDPYRAFAYYCQRLQSITDIVGKNNFDIFFIESDDLVDKTDDILDGISAFLELDYPLSSHYKSFGKTGGVYGDPSDNIKLGSIVKTEINTAEVVPDELVEIAKYYYERCKNACLKS